MFAGMLMWLRPQTSGHLWTTRLMVQRLWWGCCSHSGVSRDGTRRQNHTDTQRDGQHCTTTTHTLTGRSEPEHQPITPTDGSSDSKQADRQTDSYPAPSRSGLQPAAPVCPHSSSPCCPISRSFHTEPPDTTVCVCVCVCEEEEGGREGGGEGGENPSRVSSGGADCREQINSVS